MKRLLALVLCFALVITLFVACGREDPVSTAANVETPPRLQPTKVTEIPRETVEPYSPYLKLGESGKERIPYTINLSNARYITSVEMLPDNDCFSRFDEAYFQEKALLLVTETVRSGSVEVEIESVKIEESTATITLSHSGAGGVGTGDMAVWLLWVEVEKDLVLNWVVANPSVGSGTSNT